MRFFPSDWIAGTARMTRLHRSIYFDICCYVWDQNRPCPKSELRLMLGDVADWETLLQDLIDGGKVIRLEDGSVTNGRAAAEAAQAFDLWQRKSAGGRAGAELTNSRGTPVGTPVETADDTGAALPTQNQNQNQNQTSPSGEEARARKSLVPEDFVPVVKAGTKTADKMASWSKDYLEQQIEKFIAHHRTKGNRYTDWNRAWTTWTLNSYDERKGNEQRSGWLSATG